MSRSSDSVEQRTRGVARATRVRQTLLGAVWALLQEVLLEPAFAEDDLERIRSNAIASTRECTSKKSLESPGLRKRSA